MKMKLALTVILILISSSGTFTQGLKPQFHITIQTDRYGPVEAYLYSSPCVECTFLSASDKATSVLSQLPNTRSKVLPFSIRGDLKLPRGANGETVTGNIEKGEFAGKYTLTKTTSGGRPLRDYPAIIDSFEMLMKKRVYDPRTLKTKSWIRLLSNLRAVAAVAQNDFDMMRGFRYSYQLKPFSHLSFARGRAPAKDMISFFDSMRVGGSPVKLSFENELAILKVDTMMGLDTIEMIESAYKKIAVRNPKALVIDLRENEGGAFAVKPLIEHAINKPFDAGYFVTHKWYSDNHLQPTADDLAAVSPWQGYSLKAWWTDVQNKPLIKLRFTPAKPSYSGPVYVLVSKKSASAAELAADAFKIADNATLVGEKTAGEMLTQSPFDIAEGFQVFLPVGDYFSMKHGRIEGKGVMPDVVIDAEGALLKVLELVKERSN